VYQIATRLAARLAIRLAALSAIELAIVLARLFAPLLAPSPVLALPLPLPLEAAQAVADTRVAATVTRSLAPRHPIAVPLASELAGRTWRHAVAFTVALAWPTWPFSIGAAAAAARCAGPPRQRGPIGGRRRTECGAALGAGRPAVAGPR